MTVWVWIQPFDKPDKPFCAPERRVVAGRLRVTTRGGCRPKPQSSQRRKTGSQAVFRTDEYLTLGWIQPPDKPVSGFDSIGPDPCLTPGYPPPYIKVATRGGCRPQPESNQRRKTGSQAVFRTDEYLTPGWIQPPDKPVSVFDGMDPDPCLTPGWIQPPDKPFCAPERGPSSSCDTRRVPATTRIQ